LGSEPYTSSYGVIPYEDYEELQAHLNHNGEYISELYGQLEVTADLNRRSLIKNEIRQRERLSLIYQYLQSHPEISYSKYYDFGSLTNSGYEDNFSFFVFITTYPIIIMIVGIAVLAALIVTNDFTNGTYKFVYTSGLSRTKIVLTKLSTILTLLFSSCLLIFSTSYGSFLSYPLLASLFLQPQVFFGSRKKTFADKLSYALKISKSSNILGGIVLK
jgi:ABC-type transport system involved in multi-copper enzyme maturation permease subunit